MNTNTESTNGVDSTNGLDASQIKNLLKHKKEFRVKRDNSAFETDIFKPKIWHLGVRYISLLTVLKYEGYCFEVLCGYTDDKILTDNVYLTVCQIEEAMAYQECVNVAVYINGLGNRNAGGCINLYVGSFTAMVPTDDRCSFGESVVDDSSITERRGKPCELGASFEKLMRDFDIAYNEQFASIRDRSISFEEYRNNDMIIEGSK